MRSQVEPVGALPVSCSVCLLSGVMFEQRRVRAISVVLASLGENRKTILKRGPWAMGSARPRTSIRCIQLPSDDDIPSVLITGARAFWKSSAGTKRGAILRGFRDVRTSGG